VAEGVHGGLHRFQVRPHLDVVEQFPLQCLVEPLDLARRGGRAGLGVAGAMPFFRQMRSNSTSPGRGLVNRPVNCLPLSVRTSSGIPKVRSAWAKAAQTARPVARRTTVAMTQNREWSSTPVTTLASPPSASWMPPTMSSCHSSIGRARCHRR
jgi:choline dehydrogenase-like flavoprotein